MIPATATTRTGSIGRRHSHSGPLFRVRPKLKEKPLPLIPVIAVIKQGSAAPPKAQRRRPRVKPRPGYSQPHHRESPSITG